MRIRSRSLSQKRQKQSQEKDMTDRLVNQLRIVFPELTIEIDRQSAETHDYIHGMACTEKARCECFGLEVRKEPEPYVHVDRIKYKYATDCTLTGTDVLMRLTAAFRTVQVPKVQMYDAARIYVDVDGEQKQMKLSTYYILLHGESWYSRYGYRSDEYETEKTKNRAVIDSKLTPNLVKDINAALETAGSVSRETTFGQFAKRVDDVRKDSASSPELKNNYLRAYLVMEAYLKKTKKIKYNFYGLILRDTGRE
jgi:hypothetical protein